MSTSPCGLAKPTDRPQSTALLAPPSSALPGQVYKQNKGVPKSRTHRRVYDDIGERITLKKDQSLGRDSWEMRCSDTFHRSYIVCAAQANSVLHFGRTPLKLMDVPTDGPCNTCLKQTGTVHELDTHRRYQLL